MNFFISTIFLLVCLCLLISCAKSDVGAVLAPASLTLNTEISADGSGTVVFTATAEGAVSYDFEYGNGETATAPSGIVTYKYTQSGTNTYTVTVTARSSSGLTTKKNVDISVTVNPVLPVLFWSDEFNTDGVPDPTKWKYDIGTGSGGWGNQELEYYTNRTENAVVKDGVLKIRAIKENYSGSSYTSARLLSKDLFSFKYGKIEIRAKLPAGVGTWPAIWMLGDNIGSVGWPACGEIDIMEHRGCELNKIFCTLHYQGGSGGNANGSTTVILNATSEFHVYSLDWTASTIAISVDNQIYYTTLNTKTIPFNRNFFLIMNLAMGGTFGGSVDQGFTNATLEVDYIRVYR